MIVGLVSCHSIRYMPYLSLYKKLILQTGNDYIIINEHELETDLEEKHITFKYEKKGLIARILRYFKWRRFVIENIKKYNVSKIVFLTPWAPIKLVDRCVFQWNKRYVLDIRDYSNENSFWFKKCEEIIIKHSIITVISSKGFLKWLPKGNKYTVAHNMPSRYSVNETCESFKNSTINISYVGLVGYFPQNCSLIDSTNGTKYKMIYSGAINSSCPIEKYCQDHSYTHVKFTGVFNNSDKAALYRDCDFINAVYGNDSEVVRYALPNKLYDALIYKIPIIAHSGTFLGEVIDEYGVGLTIDVAQSDYIQQIDLYVENFDRNLFVDNCNRLLSLFEKEQYITENNIIKSLFE